jgi:hypothetical protein
MSTTPRIPSDLFARAQLIVGLRQLASRTTRTCPSPNTAAT